jgi:hypothetical protein
MATELKRIPVIDQEEAFRVINKLSQQYDMKQDTSLHQLQVSNKHYAAYYDVGDNAVKLEVIHPDVTAEQIKEFLMEFPPFF